LEAFGETTSVIALDGGITAGLVRPSVALRVTLMYVPVEFLSWKNVPPFEVAVAVGSNILEKAEFVR
jgi:hypothetical protein